MNDPTVVPYDSKKRLLRNVGMSEGGMAFDPGVEAADVVEDRAVTKQRPYELAGPFAALAASGARGFPCGSPCAPCAS